MPDLGALERLEGLCEAVENRSGIPPLQPVYSLNLVDDTFIKDSPE